VSNLKWIAVLFPQSKFKKPSLFRPLRISYPLKNRCDFDNFTLNCEMFVLRI